MRFRVEVEFMDGVKREYTCGGILTRNGAVLDAVSLLILREQNGEGVPVVDVATLPFANIRCYRTVEL